ncbi:MAG: gamma-glutamyl-gamma-aminobutyrate hydrolase family protein [Bacteroidota bacterium]
MKKPLIGITSTFVRLNELSEGVYVHQDYHQAVREAGAIPFVLPLMDEDTFCEALDRCDGVIFSGGEDVDPKYFGADPHRGLGNVFPLRDRLEILAMRRLKTQDKPMLAICRGVQVLNVAFGGTLIQDLPSQRPDAMQHMQKAARHHDTHWVDVLEGTKLYQVLGQTRVRTNSLHHQAIDEVAPGFRLCGTAGDGTIEAIEDVASRFILGVQWHPESMASHDPVMKGLFSSFVEAATVAIPF